MTSPRQSDLLDTWRLLRLDPISGNQHVFSVLTKKHLRRCRRCWGRSCWVCLRSSVRPCRLQTDTHTHTQNLPQRSSPKTSSASAICFWLSLPGLSPLNPWQHKRMFNPVEAWPVTHVAQKRWQIVSHKKADLKIACFLGEVGVVLYGFLQQIN